MEELEDLLKKSSAAATVAAALTMVLLGWMRRSNVAIAGVLSAAVGSVVGLSVLGDLPKYPPRVDLDRLLIILLPAAIVVEVAASFLRSVPSAAWALRLPVAALAARVLLHGSVYISNAGGPGTPTLTGEEQWQILGGLAVALAGVWFGLDRLAERQAQRSVALSLTVVIGAAAVAVMLTGYMTGGRIGIPIACAVAGATLASLCFANVDLRGAIGVSVVVLFSLLFIGRFFGDLPTSIAVLLFAAPLLAWVPEIAPLHATTRGAFRVSLVVLVAAAGLGLAVQKFTADSKGKSSAPGSTEPSPEDYLNFGK